MLHSYLKKVVVQRDLPLSQISCVDRAGADDVDIIYLISLLPRQKIFRLLPANKSPTVPVCSQLMGKATVCQNQKTLFCHLTDFYEAHKRKQLSLFLT